MTDVASSGPTAAGTAPDTAPGTAERPLATASVPGTAGSLGASAVERPSLLAATAPLQLQEYVLDPFTCIPKRNQKYASECTEVYLANQDAEGLSNNFCKFPNLEVVWFNMNRLTRLENLETNFRIREVFVQDNRLVSLSGLKNCKFLRVLIAKNNELQ